MKVTIDSREQNRIEDAAEYFFLNCKVERVNVEELEIGDYIFTNDNGSVVFEFKTIPDFIASIQDGRVFNQAVNMSENYDYAFVIIHGDEHNRSKSLAMTRNYHQITIYQYLGAIASLNRFVTVIESYSPFIKESYYRMFITAKKCLQQKPIVKKFPKKHKNPAFNYLAYCVYGVSAKRASEIVYSCHLETLEDLLNLTHQDLIKIDGIGDKLAEKILMTISEDSYES